MTVNGDYDSECCATVTPHEIDLVAFFRQGIWLSIGIGILIAAFLVFNVLSRDATARPDGPYFIFELGWRGLAYGVVNALLLTAFPALGAFGVLGGTISGIGRRVAFAALVLVFTIVITGPTISVMSNFERMGLGNRKSGTFSSRRQRGLRETQ